MEKEYVLNLHEVERVLEVISKIEGAQQNLKKSIRQTIDSWNEYRMRLEGKYKVINGEVYLQISNAKNIQEQLDKWNEGIATVYKDASHLSNLLRQVILKYEIKEKTPLENE